MAVAAMDCLHVTEDISGPGSKSSFLDAVTPKLLLLLLSRLSPGSYKGAGFYIAIAQC